MCSPDENWSPIQIPSNHLSEITPPLHWTGDPVHHGGPEVVDFPCVGFSGEILPRGVVPFADLEPIQQVAGVLQQPWEEGVMD